MKRLFYFMMAVLLMGSCKQQEMELVFGTTPELRIKDTLAHIKSTLVGAENGWIAYTSTVVTGGYGFYMEFGENDRLTMVADLNNTTATELKESTYRVRQIMAPTLSFDTYTYITVPQDPLGENNGGANAEGLQSDIEFEYLRTSGDSMIFQGRKYDQDLVLIKATAEERSRYRNGELANVMSAYQSFFADNTNNYIEIADEGASYKMALSYSHSSKKFSYEVLEQDETVSSATAKFYYTIDGVEIVTDFNYRGISVWKMLINPDGKLYVYDKEGGEYEVLQSPTPLTPLKSLFSYNGTYTMLYIDGDELPPGVASGFNDIFNATVDDIISSGRYTRYLQLELLNSSSLMVEYGYTAGTTNYIATATFQYEREDDIIRLTDKTSEISYSGNWNTRRNQIYRLENYFIGAEFRIDWVVSSDPDISGLGGLYPVGEENDVFYGELR